MHYFWTNKKEIQRRCRGAREFRSNGRGRSQFGGSHGSGWDVGPPAGEGRRRNDSTGPGAAEIEADGSWPPRVSQPRPPQWKKGSTTASGSSEVPANDRHREPIAEILVPTWIVRLRSVDLVLVDGKRCVVHLVGKRVQTVWILHPATAAAATAITRIVLASGGWIPSGDPRGGFVKGKDTIIHNTRNAGSKATGFANIFPEIKRRVSRFKLLLFLSLTPYWLASFGKAWEDILYVHGRRTSRELFNCFQVCF